MASFRKLATLKTWICSMSADPNVGSFVSSDPQPVSITSNGTQSSPMIQDTSATTTNQQIVAGSHVESGASSIPDLPPVVRPKRPRSSEKVRYGGAFPDCCKMINSLLNNKQAKPFEVPVDPIALNIPDYPTVITKPMDLSTIQGKLLYGEYWDADDFAEDVRLVWNNCEKYNGPDHQITVMANNLRKIFEKAFSQLKTKAFEELPEGYVPPTKGKPPKKAAKYDNAHPHRGEMTYEEKRQLCTVINHLETKYLAKVIQIINKSLPNVLDNKEPGEEVVEISVESLSTHALRELEDYVKQIKQTQQ